MILFGSEMYWEHVRLVITSYGQIENPVLEMHNARRTYDQLKIDDTSGYKLPFSYMTNIQNINNEKNTLKT